MPDTAALAALGPYFAVHEGDSSWQPLSDLVDRPDVLEHRIAQVRDGLAAAAGVAPGAVERRVAVSTAHLGLVARLIAPALAAAALGLPGAPRRLADHGWQPVLGGPFPLAWFGTDARGVVGSDVRAFVEGPVAELTAAVAGRTSLSPHVLRGNVASGVHSAARLLRAARPDLAARTDGLEAAALAASALTGEWRSDGGVFRRTNCCLFYRLSPGRPRSVCGDCVLDAG